MLQVDRALGFAGGTGAVQPETGIIRSGGGRFQCIGLPFDKFLIRHGVRLLTLSVHHHNLFQKQKIGFDFLDVEIQGFIHHQDPARLSFKKYR